MATIKVKSAEFVRKFAEIKALVLETRSKLVVEEYNRPVLVIYPSDENGEILNSNSNSVTAEIRKKLKNINIKVDAVDFD